MSEFGRTARQNGTGGTDHGHANAMFVLGGQVKGGKVYGRWPGLANEQLNEGRDLAVTTDFRQVLGEAVAKTIGANNRSRVLSLPRRIPGSTDSDRATPAPPHSWPHPVATAGSASPAAREIPHNSRPPGTSSIPAGRS
jgi:hypothetical protein